MPDPSRDRCGNGRGNIAIARSSPLVGELVGRTQATDVKWIDEADLATWAARLDAQAELPNLIRDLIRASVPDYRRLRFPLTSPEARDGYM